MRKLTLQLLTDPLAMRRSRLHKICLTSLLLAGFTVTSLASHSEENSATAESILSASTTLSADANLSATELIEQVLERSRGLSSYAEMSMTVHRPKWERRSALKAWTRGDSDSLIRFTAPAREAGNGTLKAGSQMWTYTPKLNRVIRLPSSMMAQSWGGSDFSYNDLARSDELKTFFDHSYTIEEQDDGHRVFIVTSVPHADAPVVWGKQELKIRDDIVLLEQTFFDQDLQPLKRMTGHDIKDVGDGRIIAMRLRMHSLEEDNHWTEISYQNIDFNVELKDRLFTQFSLKNP